MPPDICPICDKVVSPTDAVKLGEKGLANVLKFSIQRNDGLREKVKGMHEVVLHTACRKNYTRRISASENVFVSPPSSQPPPLLRSSTAQNFNFKNACFVCTREVQLCSPGGPPRLDRGVSAVQLDSVRDTVLKACEKRTDDWVRKVAIRVRAVPSLVTEGACYHRTCYAALLDPTRRDPSLPSPTASSDSLFSPPRSDPGAPGDFKTPVRPAAKRPATSPAEETPSRIPVPKLGRGRGIRRQGRQSDASKMKAFDDLCHKLEGLDECQFTMHDLVAMMPAGEAYSEKHLGRLLKDKYGDRVLLVDRPGDSSILCFLGAKFDLLGETWYANRCKNEQEERHRIVLKAAEIVRSDILAIVQEPEFFPVVGQSVASVVPKSLTDFLHAVTLPRKKGKGVEKTIRTCEVLAHSIISTARPRSFMSPILLGLGLWVHRKVGSRTLCEMLSTLISSVSYPIIQEFERSAVIHSSFDFDVEAYTQFVFDNFDFNSATIDGHGTIHSMGGMIFVTPKTGVPPQGRLPRLTAETRKIPLSQFGVIPIQYYKKPMRNGLSLITASDMRPGASAVSLDEAQRVLNARQTDLLWLIGNTAMPKIIPGWNGFMSSVMEGTCGYALTATIPLPFVNLNPSDPTTIFTCLQFAAEQCVKQGQKFMPTTFDQPLQWKATEIVLAAPENSPLKRIVVRLGGFHLLMSFMGAIGHVMSGSGVEELWATVYASNSVQHMCSGKAYSRAVRAHFLTQNVLLGFVLEQVFDTPEFIPQRRELLEMCRKLYQGETNAGEENALLPAVLKEVDHRLNTLQESSRTSRLWVQYIRQVELIRLLIRAERVGDWSLHLYAVKQMLPYFHAAGHLNYAKSAQLYLQLMGAAEASLPQTEKAQLFSQGFFSVRKHDRLWAGNFSDQTIEMDLMRPMKSIGGITMHGRGITESTLAVWVRSLPFCSEVIQSLENFCGSSIGTSEQHVELRDSRMSRDAQDQEIFKTWLVEHYPFDKPREQLVCLSSGLIANDTVNCEEAYNLGCAAMEKMAGKVFSEITLHRKDKAVPISAMNRSVTIRGSTVQVNPTQLFHRIIVAQKDITELENHFAYELAPFPTSLFDEKGMRKTVKSKLVDAIESVFVHSDSEIPPDPKYTIDGGFLLRKVVWPRPATYGEVVTLYSSYVTQHYGHTATVVFDGYPDGPTTKDPEHNLRAASGTSANLSISPAMTITEKQPKFLSNGRNKQQLIYLITEALERAGVRVFQARADADRLVVLSAIDVAKEGWNSVIVGTDTDLLVLLLGLSEKRWPLHFLIPASGRAGPKIHHVQKIHDAMGDAAANVLVAHPITGTDTVSALYRMSKRKALVKLSEPSLQEEVNVFMRRNQSPERVAAAGEKILLSLYGCPSFDNLNQARYYLYKRTIARQSVRAKFELASLPPTVAGAKQHSMRTYLQVQEWLGHEVDPTKWGWELRQNQFVPVATTNPPAPKELLELISCNCKGDCSRGCSCVLALLKCSNICGHCAGVSCLNADVVRDSEDSEDIDDPDDDPDDPPSLVF